jgi:hypothetical protein
MKVFIAPEFIEDLKSAKDLRFVQAVLSSLMDAEFQFLRSKEDHRYEGIKDGWIRYASAGKTAYRIVYIQRGDSVYFYRAGDHSIERKLGSPKNLEVAVPLGRIKPEFIDKAFQFDYGNFLRTSAPIFLSKVLHSMFHVGHFEIYLVCPFISFEIVSRHHPFGRFLDKAVEENTDICLITRPPDNLDFFVYFDDLESRLISVYYYPNLHSKLYIFRINPETVLHDKERILNVAIVGSANLTNKGLSLEGGGNEELCFRVPSAKFFEALDYAAWLKQHSCDHVSQKLKSLRR